MKGPRLHHPLHIFVKKSISAKSPKKIKARIKKSLLKLIQSLRMKNTKSPRNHTKSLPGIKIPLGNLQVHLKDRKLKKTQGHQGNVAYPTTGIGHLCLIGVLCPLGVNVGQ